MPNPYAQHLSADQLKRHTNPDIFPKNLPKQSYDKTFGQARAISAINTALDIKASGYHIFAVGENGLGKRTIITDLLANRAKNEATPPDLVYVHNFANPRLPKAITLPTGTGKRLAHDMEKLWANCYKKLSQKFTSLSYQNQLGSIKQSLQLTEKKLVSDFNEHARPHNIALNVPVLPSELLGDDDKIGLFQVLDVNCPIDDTALIRLQKKLVALNHTLDELENTINARIDSLHDTLAKKVLEPLFKPIFKKYASDINANPTLGQYLNDCLNDMIAHAIEIVDGESNFSEVGLDNTPARYGVNVLVSHKAGAGSPIVFEELPTHLNLLGHIEYRTELGTVYSDVSMVRAGALHRANGGYLLLEAQSLLEHPYAWQGLKRALQSRQIRISSLEQMLTLTGSLSLEPDGVGLDVKVVLLGEPDLYYELLEFEPEFNSVFKIRADFHDSIERTSDSEIGLASKILDIVKSEQLPPFDGSALACILDELSRITENQHRLDLHTGRLRELVLETACLAKQQNQKLVCADHVKAALAQNRYHKGYLQTLYWQEIKNGQQLISTQGTAVGQINALTVISYADSEFGLPARLTAVIAPKFGNGEILDIERDVELGGSLHAKGMLIMASFLRSRFSEFHELNFSASLAFEQSYGQIDGDSATLAECCALLSALANVPLKQNLAITGSMNQLGQAQAIGGINAKIAGFFDVCCEQGLDGTQGVILPHANLANLMLRDDIIAAVKAEQFHLYAIDDIYGAMALLTDMAIDNKSKKGEFKKGTLFGKIMVRLFSWHSDEKK